MSLINIVNQINNKVSTYISKKKTENQVLENAINNSKSFTLNMPFCPNQNNVVDYYTHIYESMCPYVNHSTCEIINNIIPINEYVLNIVDIKEKKERKEYLMILTSLRIIIMDKDKYTIIPYESITEMSLISKSLMTQIINFNGIILDINLNYDDLLKVYNTITNNNFRQNEINNKTKYLEGINPIYEKINKFGTGISIDNNNTIVFHDQMQKHYKYQINDILNYELMEDNTVIMSKTTKEETQAIKNTKTECYKITMRLTMTNNFIIELTILPPNTFNNSYSHMDSTYKEYINFGKTLINKLEEYNPIKKISI